MALVWPLTMENELENAKCKIVHLVVKKYILVIKNFIIIIIIINHSSQEKELVKEVNEGVTFLPTMSICDHISTCGTTKISRSTLLPYFIAMEFVSLSNPLHPAMWAKSIAQASWLSLKRQYHFRYMTACRLLGGLSASYWQIISETALLNVDSWRLSVRKQLPGSSSTCVPFEPHNLTLFTFNDMGQHLESYCRRCVFHRAMCGRN